MRKNENIKCKICGFDTKTNGLANHITNIHKIEMSEYVKNYGEYRPKYLNYNKRAATADYKCLICNEKLASERHLSFHIIKNHNITKKEYIIKYILNGKIPKCKCGCGCDVNIKERGVAPYWSDYKSGHNTQQTHIGMQRTYDSKMKMRKSAIERMQRGDAVFYRGKSKDEIIFGDYIKSIYSGNIKFNDTELLSGHEIDVYLPELKIAFELNGERFHSDLYKQKNYHKNKTDECNKLGVRLVQIWLTDWKLKPHIVKSQINNFINNTQIRIYARNCIIREISNSDANKFLDENHLQGKTISKYRYGLFYNDNIVQIITFGNLRNAVGHIHSNGSYELIRLCSKINTVVIGGASRLLNHFIKIINPVKIISFAHRDWSNGNVYEKLGMSLIDTTNPGYFYSNGTRKEHRYNFQKHKLVKMGFDINKSEYEIMLERGYYRIWDCGNLKYEMNF